MAKKLIKKQTGGIKITKEPFNNFIRTGYGTGASNEMTAESRKDSANTNKLDKVKADRKADLIRRGLIEKKKGGSTKAKKRK